MTEQMVTGALLGLWLGLVIGYLVTAPVFRALEGHRGGSFLRGSRFRGPDRG